jgi:hypothetical protein
VLVRVVGCRDDMVQEDPKCDEEVLYLEGQQRSGTNENEVPRSVFGSYVCVASAPMSVFRAIEEGKGFQFSSRNLINIIFVRRYTKTWCQYFTCGGYADCVLFAQRLSCGLISLTTIVSSPHHGDKVWSLLEHREVETLSII